MRMISGLLAPQQGSFTLVGDASLSRRPMERIRKPLEAMGARITLTDGHAPMTIEGSRAQANRLHHPGSQRAGEDVHPAGRPANRGHDHGERVRPHPRPQRTGLARLWRNARRARWIRFRSPARRHSTPSRRRCPATLFCRILSLCRGAVSRLQPGADSLGLNPTRAALLDVLTALGAKIAVLHLEEKHAELVGTVQISAPARALGSTKVSGALAAQLIDELPVLAAIAPLHQRRHPHPRRKGTARQGVRPHRTGGEEPARHGRGGSRV